MIIRHMYDGLQDEVSQLTGLDCSKDKGQTKQSMKDDCDINLIVKRYEKTGALPDMIRSEPRYGDFSEVPTFQDALGIVHLAEEQFAALDAPLRRRFGNNPVEFLEFATNPSNIDEMIKLGLATAREIPAPIPVPAVAPGGV